MSEAIVVFSGGPDSTAAALWAKEQFDRVRLLTLQFKSRSQYGELRSAMRVAEDLGLHHDVVNLQSAFHPFGDLHILMHTSPPPTVRGRDSQRLGFGAGVVLSYTLAYSLFHKIEEVVWGATADDAFDNFEYSAEFAAGLASLASRSANRSIAIRTPFAEKRKYQALEVFGAHPELFARTWSCKINTYKQSGKCHACVARRLAALIAGVDDKSKYETQDWKVPVSKDQLRDPSKLSAKEWARVLGSEKSGGGPLNGTP